MRVIYWNTSCLEPDYEAISKEVFQLSRRFQPSLIFSINRNFTIRASWRERYVGFHPKFDLLLRGLIPVIAQAGDIHHIYGELCPWIFYKALQNVRPLILTVASEKGSIHNDFFDRCQKIIVQTETLRNKILESGIDESKVMLLYPSVEDSSFAVSANQQPLKGTPKLLFATAPRSQEEMEGRGVNLLFDAAKQTKNIDLTLLYRPWKTGYTSLRPTQELLAEHPFENVTLRNVQISNMSDIYKQHHFIVLPYTCVDGGKECPNSVVEGLASGLPALISSACPFAYFVEKYQCGVVFDPNPSQLLLAVEKGVQQYARLSSNAIRAAQECFSQKAMYEKIGGIYQELLGRR